MKQLLLLFFFFCLSANAQEQFTFYFNHNEAVTAKDILKWLDDNHYVSIRKIYGYSDKSGDAAYNQVLSERRADYIYERLKASDAEFENVEKKGFGESESTANHNGRDRKVVVYYSAPQIYEVSVLRTEFSRTMKTAKKGDKVLLKDVYFRGGTAYLLEESGPVLKELYTIMRDNPKLKISIEGHICCETEDIGNLSEKRAVEIYLYLKNNGIKADRMTVKGFGSTRPIHPLPERNSEEMADNRRVEIEIVAN